MTVQVDVIVEPPHLAKLREFLERAKAALLAQEAEARRLAGAKAALAEKSGPRVGYARHGVDAAAYAAKLEEARDKIAMAEAMQAEVDECDAGRWDGLTWEEVVEGWRVVTDGQRAIKAQVVPYEQGAVSAQVRYWSRGAPGAAWSSQDLNGEALNPLVGDALAPYTTRHPSRLVMFEMGRALHEALAAKAKAGGLAELFSKPEGGVGSKKG